MSKDWRAQAVVVTGSSGSGKSAVCRMLQEQKQALVLSADEFAHEALKPGSPALAEIRKVFGESFFNGEELNRRALGNYVFNSPAERLKLEQIVHPIVQQLTRKAFIDRGGENASLVVYDCPLFFEANLGSENFRSVVLVTAPEEQKIERIMKRDGISKEEASARLKSQWPDERKIPLASAVIVNDSTLVDLEKQVERCSSFS